MIHSEKLIKTKVTLTVVTNPASAYCYLSTTSGSYPSTSSKTITVDPGTTVYYKLSYNSTKTGSVVVNSDRTLNATESYSASSWQTWSQPTLSSDGTLGSGKLSVYATANACSTNGPAWKAFDGSTSTSMINSTAKSVPKELTWYSYDYIKISQVQGRNGANYFPRNYTFYGSNNNSSWTQITSGTLTGGASATWTISISNSTSYYYHKLSISSCTRTDPQWGNHFWNLVELYITAQYAQTSYSYYWTVS